MCKLYWKSMLFSRYGFELIYQGLWSSMVTLTDCKSEVGSGSFEDGHPNLIITNVNPLGSTT